MNVGTVPLRSQQLETTRSRIRNAEPAISFDSSERRMEHSSFQSSDILQDFWNLTQRMPRQDQMSLAATVLASQSNQNGISNDTRSFIANLKTRFDPSEIETIRGMFEKHASLKSKSEAQIQDLWNQIQQVLSGNAAEETGDSLTENGTRPLLRTPEEIYFQTTLNTIDRVNKVLAL
ncbi:hypothetical protein KBA41_01370 [Candidatus Ozemobacteraceae bacterium]|nr:hypothetical protein [Candidatus Ozemobacteraceae bacterium]